MIHWRENPKYQARFGIAVVEYSILLGLIAVLALGGLCMLGNSTYNLFAGTGNALYKLGFGNFTPLKDLTSQGLAWLGWSGSGTTTTSGAANAGPTAYLKGGGYYELVTDPTTGQPVLKMVKGSSGVNVNVSSVEGSRYNTLGSIMLANRLDELAAEQTDPQLKSYYGQLAKYAYYLGGTEGVMDNVQEVAWDNVTRGHEQVDPNTGNVVKTYTLGDGLRDMYTYQGQLQSLLTNPPANLNSAELAQVLPYAVDVTNIAQNYLSNFSKFIGPNGEVTQNFGDPNRCYSTGGCDVGTPGPGAALKDSANAVADPPLAHEMLGMTYDSLVPLNQLKVNADKVLADYNVTDVPVKATFQDAKTVDAHEP